MLYNACILFENNFASLELLRLMRAQVLDTSYMRQNLHAYSHVCIKRIELSPCDSFKSYDFQKKIDSCGITYPMLTSDIRRQPIIPDNVSFPCNVRSGRYNSI